ncbi:MAG: enoyl-CoA hydratase/isomerase family protein [Marinobacter sp.]
MGDTNQTSNPAIEFTLDDGIAILKMNRPKQRNPFSPEFCAEIEARLNEIKANTDVRVLILTGTDGVFSAGGDLNGMKERVERTNAGLVGPGDFRQRLYNINRWVQGLRNLEIPVIAAVDGPAYGGAFGLAMCADFVLCSERAEFCAAFARIGAVPDCGLLYTLPRIVGVQRSKEIMATGRAIGADEAKQLGLALDVYPAESLREEALGMARQMLNACPVAFGITKRVLNQVFDLDANAVLEMEASGQAICFTTDYHKDSVQRFLDKRPLNFSGVTRRNNQ